jgi:hypothetical protein
MSGCRREGGKGFFRGRNHVIKLPRHGYASPEGRLRTTRSHATRRRKDHLIFNGQGEILFWIEEGRGRGIITILFSGGVGGQGYVGNIGWGFTEFL